MKLALGRHGKLLLALVSIPLILVLAVSIRLTFHRSALQEDYDKIQVGMHLHEIRPILKDDPAVLRTEYGVSEPLSLLSPGCSFTVTLDWDSQRVIDKEFHHPTVRQIWNHWMRQLGL